MKTFFQFLDMLATQKCTDMATLVVSLSVFLDLKHAVHGFGEHNIFQRRSSS